MASSGKSDVSDDWAARAGASIRALRQELSLTLVELAGKTGLSHSFLSQVERGRAHPSMQSLYEIAQALGTTQARLVGGPDDPDEGSPVVLLRAHEGVRLGAEPGDPVPAEPGGARELIAAPGSFYPIEFTALGRSFTGEWFQHSGVEFAYVATGLIEVELGDGVLYTLEPGDSLRYPGWVPHRWRAKSRARSRVLMVHTRTDSLPEPSAPG